MAILAVTSAGCGAPSPEPVAEGEWGNATAEQELAIGVEAGPDAYMLGSVRSMAVAADGTMYVVDGQAMVIRVYDAGGTHLRDIGAEGQGPGEFSGAPAVRLLRDGTLAVWDYRNSRVSFLTAEGEFVDSFPGISGFGGHTSLLVDTAENLYMRTFNRDAPTEADTVLVKYSRAGEQLGRIELPLQDAEGRTFYLGAEGSIAAFQVVTLSTWSPYGYVVTGRNDVYDIEVRDPEGTVHLRRELAPIAVAAEEHAEWEAFRQGIIERARAQGRDPQYDPDLVPDTKPFFRNIFVGEDGRIWVWRFVAAEKRDDVEPLPERPERPLLTSREPWTYDVFEPDGTFLGSVQVPELLEPLVFRGDRIWGALPDEAGVERVVRLRVVPEGQ